MIVYKYHLGALAGAEEVAPGETLLLQAPANVLR